MRLIEHLPNRLYAIICLCLIRSVQAQDEDIVPSDSVVHAPLIITAERNGGVATGVLQTHPLAQTINLQDWSGAASARLEDLLAWEGLASAGPSAAPDLNTAVQMRGFVSGADPGTGLGTARIYMGLYPDVGRRHVRDLFTVDKVTVLQGPDATLSGMGSPAGVVQYQGKVASAQEMSTTVFTSNSAGLQRLALDMNRPLGNIDSGLSTRLVTVSQRQGQTPEGVGTDRDVLYWTSRWRAANQVWDFTLEDQHNHQPFSFGTVYINGQFCYDQAYVDPTRSKANRHYQRLALTHERQLNDGLALNMWWNEAHTYREETLVGYYNIVSPSTLSGYWREIDETTHQRNTGIGLSGQYSGQILSQTRQHNWLVRWQRNSQRLQFAGPQNTTGFMLDAAQPDFSGVDRSMLTMTPRWWLDEMHDDTLSLRDALHWSENWRMHGAMSYTRARIDSASTRTMSPPSALIRVTDTHWIGKSMALEHFSERGAQWIGYGTGFEPTRGQQRDGSYLPTVQSMQWELGWRSTPRMWSTLFWQNTQIHVAGIDPQDKNYLAPTGTVRAQGMSIKLEKSSPYWHWQTQWHRQHVRTTTPANVGIGPYLAGMAEQWASLRLRAQHWLGQPWVMLQAVSPKPGDDKSSFHAPGYALLHFGMSKSLDEHWTLTGQINNVFDKRYIATLAAADAVWQGPRRMGMIELVRQR